MKEKEIVKRKKMGACTNRGEHYIFLFCFWFFRSSLNIIRCLFISNAIACTIRINYLCHFFFCDYSAKCFLINCFFFLNFHLNHTVMIIENKKSFVNWPENEHFLHSLNLIKIFFVLVYLVIFLSFNFWRTKISLTRIRYAI